MFESMKNLNSITKWNLKNYIKNMKKSPKWVLEEQQRYFAYIKALHDMDITTEQQDEFLFEIGQYMIEKYTFRWNREMIKEFRKRNI